MASCPTWGQLHRRTSRRPWQTRRCIGGRTRLRRRSPHLLSHHGPHQVGHEATEGRRQLPGQRPDGLCPVRWGPVRQGMESRDRSCGAALRGGRHGKGPDPVKPSGQPSEPRATWSRARRAVCAPGSAAVAARESPSGRWVPYVRMTRPLKRPMTVALTDHLTGVQSVRESSPRSAAGRSKPAHPLELRLRPRPCYLCRRVDWARRCTPRPHQASSLSLAMGLTTILITI
jgi:hypothetical protein